MFSNLSTSNRANQLQCDSSVRVCGEERYNRNEEEDLQKAIGYLYDFKRKLDTLHPGCVTFIENMLQRPRY